MFVSNNHASFYLRSKKNLVKHQNVSKYYDHDCVHSFGFLPTLWIITPIDKNSHILVRIYFIFLKKIQARPNLKGFQYQIWKHHKISYQLGQILAFFCKLLTQIACSNCWNCVKGCRFIKIAKQIKFEGVLGKLDTRICFPRQSWTKCLRKALLFIWNSAQRENWNFYV